MFCGKSCGRNAGTSLKSGTPGGLKLQRRTVMEFDEEAEASAEKEIADMRAALEKQNEETMHALESQMEQMASVLDQEYESKIDTRADEIVKKILE